MRKLAAIAAITLTLAAGGCDGDKPAPTSAPTTTSAPVTEAPAADGTPAGGDAGEVTVAEGDTVILEDADGRVAITVESISEPEAGFVWYDVTVDVSITVVDGRYLASPYNFTLVGADGAENPPLEHTFDEALFTLEEGETAEATLTFSVEQESTYDGATIGVFGIGDETEVVVAHYPV